MYIGLNEIFVILALMGIVGIVYLIVTLNNINKLIKYVNTEFKRNSGVINESLSKLPSVINNFHDVSENMKDVTEAVTDLTADAVIAKETVKTNLDLVTEIMSIVKSIFSR